MNLEIKPNNTSLRIIYNPIGQILRIYEFSHFLNEERDITTLVNSRLHAYCLIPDEQLTVDQVRFKNSLEEWFKDAQFERLNQLADQEGA